MGAFHEKSNIILASLPVFASDADFYQPERSRRYFSCLVKKTHRLQRRAFSDSKWTVLYSARQLIFLRKWRLACTVTSYAKSRTSIRLICVSLCCTQRWINIIWPRIDQSCQTYLWHKCITSLSSVRNSERQQREIWAHTDEWLYKLINGLYR